MEKKTTKCIKSFTINQYDEFIEYMMNILEEGGSITCYEAFDEVKSEVWGYDEDDTDVIIFLSDDFTLKSVLAGALDTYGQDLNITLEYDEENPIECEDGEIIYQKYLKVELA